MLNLLLCDRKTLKLQKVKDKIMIKVNNPNQLNIFDPWAFVTPKRRQMLDAGWPGLFREHILPSIPVNKVSKYFNATFGRPTKELYSMLGALILQGSITGLLIAFIEASLPFYTFQKLCRKYHCISHNEFQAFRFPFP